MQAYLLVEATADKLEMKDFQLFQTYVFAQRKKGKLKPLELYARWAKNREIPDEMGDYLLNLWKRRK